MKTLTHALVMNALPPAPALLDPANRPLPLGPLSLAASAAAAGYRVAFADPVAAGLLKVAGPTREAELAAAGPVGRGAGMPQNPPASRVDALADQMEGPWPLLAVSCMSAALPLVLLAVSEFRRRNPESLVVLGGPGPSAVGRGIIEGFEAVDAVCSGPGEQVFPAILAAAEQVGGSGGREEALRRLSGVPGLWVRAHGRPWLNRRTTWTELPEEVRRLMPTLVDRRRYSSSAPVVTAFGCLHMCDFCSIDSLWPRPVWRRPEYVVQDAAHFARGLGYREFDILDDCFTLDEIRLRAVVDRLRAVSLAGPGRPLTWSCQGRADHLTDALLDYMAESGCREISLGIESGSAHVLRIIRKGIRVPEAMQIVRQAAARMRVNVSLLFGFPYETLEDFDETRRLFLQFRGMKNVTPSLHLVTPFADSPLFDAYSDRLGFSPELLPLSFNAYEPGEEELELAESNRQLFPDFFHYVSPDLGDKIEAARELLGL